MLPPWSEPSTTEEFLFQHLNISSRDHFGVVFFFAPFRIMSTTKDNSFAPSLFLSLLPYLVQLAGPTPLSQKTVLKWNLSFHARWRLGFSGQIGKFIKRESGRQKKQRERERETQVSLSLWREREFVAWKGVCNTHKDLHTHIYTHTASLQRNMCAITALHPGVFPTKLPSLGGEKKRKNFKSGFFFHQTEWEREGGIVGGFFPTAHRSFSVWPRGDRIVEWGGILRGHPFQPRSVREIQISPKIKNNLKKIFWFFYLRKFNGCN